ncbi:MAG TPA: EAL domain-containing protein [Sphingomicrobium sp.]|nr:EAL domain-containing protein [Sphingomicrobium sp.]
MRGRQESKTDRTSFKALLWTALAALIFGLTGAGDIAEDLLRTTRNSLHWHKASGDIVLVKIDDESLHKVGRWPWPRRYQAQLVDRLTEAGSKRIVYDVTFSGPTTAEDDALFADALERSGRVVLPILARSGPGAGLVQDSVPLPQFARHVQLGTPSVRYNYQNAVWQIPYAIEIQGKPVPHYTALLSGVHGNAGDFFMPDYALDPKSIPTLSAAQVLAGKFSPAMVRGKDVIIGTTTDAAGDQYFIPGTGKTGGVYVHVIGAETLKAGRPISAGWVPALLVALLVAGLAQARRNPFHQFLLLGATFGFLLLGPAALEAHLVFVDIVPGLFAILVFAAVLGRRYLRQRGEVNAVSGLPNLNALQANRAATDQALIVARIWNYPEVVATLPSDSERQLVEQIIGRLSVGTSDRTFYHGDSGIFAWFEEGRKPFGHHIDALYALFRNPVRVSGLSIDLAISFGVEIGSGRSLANRLASALVAAEEAAHDGLKWKYHDPDTFENASWKLSMLSQLDTAIDNDEVWIAFQPKLDLKSRRIIGAEVLARWTHPEKGPIAASEFVAAAEQHDRIGKLTDFVLEKAVSAAAAINKRGRDFDVAVNLSARLLNDKQFIIRAAAVLARHGLEPRRLTLELTETAELAARGEALEMLGRLRELGVQISIDDYGTGLSTLDYLKKIPATEIKIDQSFVKGLCDNRSDRLMVHSTIGLAHSLGRKVVAEGVEHREILDALVDMGCDVAQGFIIGRPMSLESLNKRLSSDRGRGRRVA